MEYNIGGNFLDHLEVFDRKDKKQAVKVVSRTNASLVWYSLIGIAAIFLIQFLGTLIFGEKFTAFYESPYYAFIMQVVGMYLIAFPLLCLMLRSLPTAQRKESDMDLEEFGYIFLVSEAIVMAGAMLSSWLTDLVGNMLGHEIVDTTSDLIRQTPLWLVILVAVILGPIVEELIFRKIMIDKLSVYGDRVAIVITAVTFGLFHGNLYQLFYATALGLVLGYMYAKTRRSIYNVVLHIIINFMGTVPTLLLTDSLNRLSEVTEETVMEGQLAIDMLLVSGYSLLQYGLAFAGVAVLVIAIKNQAIDVPNECDISVPAKHRFRVFFFNFGTILFLAYAIAQYILSFLG